jgi:hypothetical protein
MKWVLLFFSLFFSSTASAEFRHFSEWNDKEKTEYLLYTGLAYIDYSQTSWAMKQKTPNGMSMFMEKNPIYGKNPSNDKIILGQLIGISIYYYYIGANDDRFSYHFARGILMGSKIVAVVHNDAVGVSISKAW